MKKCILFHLILIIFAVFYIFSTSFNCCQNNCYAQDDIEKEMSESIEKTLDEIDFSELENYLIDSGISERFFDGKNVRELLADILYGKLNLDIFSILQLILNLSLKSIKSYLSALSVVLVIILICFMFNKIKSNLQKESLEEIIYFVCFAAVVAILVNLSKGVIENATGSLVSMQKQMNILFPILLTLMTGLGATNSVAAFTPMVSVLSTLISNIFVYLLVPMFFLIFTLLLINNLSKNTKFNKLISFFKSLFKWITGVVFSVFFMYFSMQAITVATTDGLTLKAAKFAIKNYVPLVGGYVSEGFEIAKAGLLLVKNSVGLVGVLIMLASVLSPVLLIAMFSLMLKFLAGILEPLGDGKSVEILSSVADSFKLLLTCVFVVSVMYMLSVFLMISTVSGVGL